MICYILLCFVSFFIRESAGGEAVKPRFKGRIRNATVTVGGDASFSCMAEDMGKHKVAWIHNERKLIVSIDTIITTRISRYSVTNESQESYQVWTLHITGVEEEDRGHYMCQINTDPMLSQVGYLQVVVVPEAQVRLGSSLNPNNIKEGDDVYFECSILANPRAYKITWQHNGRLLEANPSSGVIVSNQSLVLQRVTRQHAGRYSCTASNIEGDGTASFINLDVKYAPVCAPDQMMTYGVARHEDAEVTCKVNSNPPAQTFKWTFNNTADTIDVPPGRFTTAPAYSIITYTPMTELDYGTLLCWAHNDIGNQALPCLFHIVPAGASASDQLEKRLSTPDTKDKLDKGTWGEISFCPKKFFAKSVELKITGPTNDANAVLDETVGVKHKEDWEHEGLKGIKLYCSNGEDDLDEPISSSVSPLGNWRKKQSCENGYLTAFHVRSDSISMGLTGVPIICNGTTNLIGGGIGLGNYLGRLQYCPPGMVINGLRTRLDNEVAQGLTDVEFYCCNITGGHNVGTTETITSDFCPVSYTSIGGQCLYFNTLEKLSQSDAEEACQMKNGHLATVKNYTEIKKYIETHHRDIEFWFGATDSYKEGTWRWNTGELLINNFPWCDGEPNNAYGAEECMIYGYGRKCFIDYNCDTTFYSVCEVSPTHNKAEEQEKEELLFVGNIKAQYSPRIVSHSEDQYVEQGNNVTLECSVEGNPVPRILWSRTGDILPSGAHEEEGPSLIIQDVDRHVEGNYTCKAENGIGNPDFKSMFVYVEYKPEIITEKAIFRTDEDDRVELVCIVYSRPIASVKWLKNNTPLPNEPNIREHEGGQRHALVINQFSVEDFGNYKCIAENSKGFNTGLLQITDVPKPPHIISDKEGGEENNYVLTWETESYYPITKYQIKYRKAKENDSSAESGSWENMSMFDTTLISVIKNEGLKHTMKHHITNLDVGTAYQVEVKVKNQLQWSEPTIFTFSTKKGTSLCRFITRDKCREAPFKTLCPRECHIQLRFVESVTERFIGPYDKIWNDHQCRPLRLSYGPSLIECMAQCEEKSGCTAINYMRKNHHESPLIWPFVSECVLRGCELPVPKPANSYHPYHGYSLRKR